MIQPRNSSLLSIVQYFGAWRRFSALCVCLFLARAFFVLSVYPPLEGWDEYQHIAYVEYLLKHGEAPVFNDGNYVPRSMHALLVEFPHSANAVDQVQFIGGVSYETFWSLDAPPAVNEEAPPIRLYQAQHSALYYRLVAPLYAWSKAQWGFLGAVTTLRALNVLLGAGAAAIALIAVGRIVRDGPFRLLIGLAIALQPLYLLNVARVANDAPAVLFGTAAVAMMLLMGRKPTVRGAIALGAVLGLSILFKTINLGLLPLAAFVYLYAGRQAGWRRGIGCGVLALACAAVITAPYFAFNLKTFGMLTPMQEAIQNRADGRTFGDYFEAFKNLNWYREISSRYARHSLWRGGWSMLLPEWRMLGVDRLLLKAHEVLILFAGVGALWLLAPQNRRERLILHRGDSALRIVVLWLGVTAALCYHMLQTRVALPNVATNIWYAAVTFPFLIVLLGQGYAAFISPRLGQVLLAALGLVFLATELYGTRVVMVRAYAQTPWGELARERLATLHVWWWGPHATTAAMAVVIALAAAALMAAVTRQTQVAEPA